MGSSKKNIVIIDDDKSHSDFFASVLNPTKYSVKVFNVGIQGFNYLLSPEVFPDAIVVDNYMPDIEGVEIIDYFVTNGYDYAFIILTGNGSIDLAVKALKLGALNYIAKSLSIKDELEVVVGKTIQQNSERLEKKQIERLLVESEQRLKKQFKNFPIPTYTWEKTDGDFILVDYNNAAMNSSNGTIEKSLNHRLNILYRDRPDMIEKIYLCFNSQAVIKQEHEYIYQSTKELKYYISTYVYLPDDIVMVHTEDITDRKNAEQQLKTTYNQLKTVFETIPAAIIVISTDLTVIDCNEQMLLQCNVKDKTEILGEKCVSRCNLDKKDCKYCIASHISAFEETNVRITEPNEYNDGHIYKIFSNPIKDNDQKSIGIVEVIVDITDEKNTELKLRELNTTKDKLFSIIGHDLRGPIGEFKMLMETLLSGVYLSDAKQLTNILKAFLKSANSTYDLLENLLAWAKSQRNEIVYAPARIKLKELVLTTINLFSELFHNKQISIIDEIPESTEVFADRNMLLTVLRNLISNAIKFTPNGKQIRIIADENDLEHIITIKDEGMGIKPENLSKLFKSSEHLTTYGTNGEKGSGLGLLLCKDFVEKHNGKIWVESELDKGCEVMFTIIKQELAKIDF